MTTSTMMSAGTGSSCPAVAATTMLAGSGCLAQVWRKGRRYMKENKGKKDKRMTQTIKNEVKKKNGRKKKRVRVAVVSVVERWRRGCTVVRGIIRSKKN